MVVADLRHGDIWWHFARDEETEGPRPGASSGRKLLRAFAAVSSPASAVSFVRRFGPLGLCREHGLPGCIPCGYWPRWGALPRAPAVRDADGTGYYVESLDGYLFFARFARAVLRIAAQLKRGSRRAPEDWETVDELVEREAQREPVLGPWVATLGRMRTNLGSSGEWLALVFALNLLAMRCRASPSCTPRADYSKHGLRVTGIELGIEPDAFSAIGFQLINTVARGKEIYLCSYCGALYTPARRPNPNRRNFCDDCRAEGFPSVSAPGINTSARRPGRLTTCPLPASPNHRAVPADVRSAWAARRRRGDGAASGEA